MSSLVPEPHGLDAELHLVLCDFGRCGQAIVETDPQAADRDTIIDNLVSGQYRRPLRVLAMRVGGECRDVSSEIAFAVVKAAAAAGETLPADTRDFVAECLGHSVLAT